MQLWILLKDFFQDIKTQKLRAFLTIVAITWGTLAVILLMAFGEGLSFRMGEGLLNAGDMIIRVYGGQTTIKYQGLPVGRDIRLVDGVDGSVLWIDGEKHRALEAMPNRQDLTEHRHRLLRPILFIAGDQDNVFAFAGSVASRIHDPRVRSIAP